MNNNIIMVVLGVVVLAVIGYVVFLRGGSDTQVPAEQQQTQGQVQQPAGQPADAEGTIGDEAVGSDQLITLEQIAEHNSAEDCWLAIEGKVYDVTGYIADQKHPGGAAILQGCGKDATQLFNERPNGSGPHSATARSFLPNFLIGELAD